MVLHMARTADHAGRRRQIADAVQQLIARDGYDGVTISKVAAEAGISVGLVQHYFTRKDDLLLFAYGQVLADVRRRAETRIANGERNEEPIRTMLFDALCELLPLDTRRRSQYRIGEAFWGRALDSPDLARTAQQTATDLRAEISRAVRNGKECGEVEEQVDSDAAALRINAMVDGLARVLYREATAAAPSRRLRKTAVAELDHCLADIFTGHCHHYG